MSDARRLTLIDLFCGTGGFAHGFTQSNNFDLLYAIDADRDATRTASLNHVNTRIEVGDIRGVDLKALKAELGVSDVDVIIGGPPCQGFSSLRPNRGKDIDDDRNNLYIPFANFIEAFRPKLFVLENVVGLVTHKHGSTLRRIEEKFTNVGYSICWKILNAASFGVPQKRERFIMIGCLDGRPIKFPIPSHSFDGKVVGHKDRERFLIEPMGLPGPVTVNEAINDLPVLGRGEKQSVYKSDPYTEYQKARRGVTDCLTLHKAANHSDKMMEVIRHAGDSIACIPPHLITSGFTSCYSRLDGEAPSTTITVKFQSPASSKCIHPVQDRTITPREAARLQSFDDDFCFFGSYTSIARQLGNAVPPLLGKVIGGAVREMLC